MTWLRDAFAIAPRSAWLIGTSSDINHEALLRTAAMRRSTLRISRSSMMRAIPCMPPAFYEGGVAQGAEGHVIALDKLLKCRDLPPVPPDLFGSNGPAIRPGLRLRIEVDEHRPPSPVRSASAHGGPQAIGVLHELRPIKVGELQLPGRYTVAHDAVPRHSIAPDIPPVGVRERGLCLPAKRLVTLALDSDQVRLGLDEHIEPRVPSSGPREPQLGFEEDADSRPGLRQSRTERRQVPCPVEEVAEGIGDERRGRLGEASLPLSISLPPAAA